MGMMQENYWHIHLDTLMIFFLSFLSIAQGCLFFFLPSVTIPPGQNVNFDATY